MIPINHFSWSDSLPCHSAFAHCHYTAIGLIALKRETQKYCLWLLKKRLVNSYFQIRFSFSFGRWLLTISSLLWWLLWRPPFHHHHGGGSRASCSQRHNRNMLPGGAPSTDCSMPPNGQCPNGGGDKLKGASLTGPLVPPRMSFARSFKSKSRKHAQFPSNLLPLVVIKVGVSCKIHFCLTWKCGPFKAAKANNKLLCNIPEISISKFFVLNLINLDLKYMKIYFSDRVTKNTPGYQL